MNLTLLVSAALMAAGGLLALVLRPRPGSGQAPDLTERPPREVAAGISLGR
jgi:hypothetical protein